MGLTDAPQEQQRPPQEWGWMRKMLPFTSIGVLIAILYVAWTFYSRRASEEAATKAAQAKEQEQRQRTVDAVFGNGEVQFSLFSADKGLLSPGEHTQLCYGVVNAKSVKLDPPIAEIAPKYRSCLEIAPTKTTTYTITADDGKGHTKSSSLTVKVR
jgi:hypothetical protein